MNTVAKRSRRRTVRELPVAARDLTAAPASGQPTRPTVLSLSTAQRKALSFAETWYPLRDGSIEQGLQIGVTGAALDSVIKSLEHQGLVDEHGALTAAGEAELRRQDPPTPCNPRGKRSWSSITDPARARDYQQPSRNAQRTRQ
jgi:hypothetical protein